MALQGRITTGLNPRQLQEGLNKIIDNDLKTAYYGPYEKIFPLVSHNKYFYEIQKMAGMGLAGLRGEGAALSAYDSIDQAWYYAPRLLTYEKAARISIEAQHYNLYAEQLPRIGKELVKSQKQRRDVECSNVFNSAFDTNIVYGDGKALCVSDHPVQAGGTLSNVLTQDFSEDAVEQARILAYGFVNDDGQLGNYELRSLVYPTALMHEVERVLMTPYRPASAENDINANQQMGDIKDKVLWKRLSDIDSFFFITDCPDGLFLAESMPITLKPFADNFTFDDLVSSISMWAPIVADSARSVIGSAGI